jgi:hypothetical protein
LLEGNCAKFARDGATMNTVSRVSCANASTVAIAATMARLRGQRCRVELDEGALPEEPSNDSCRDQADRTRGSPGARHPDAERESEETDGESER